MCQCLFCNSQATDCISHRAEFLSDHLLHEALLQHWDLRIIIQVTHHYNFSIRFRTMMESIACLQLLQRLRGKARLLLLRPCVKASDLQKDESVRRSETIYIQDIPRVMRLAVFVRQMHK